MIVVTGSEGLIGKSLINHFLKNDRKVIGIDISKCSANKKIKYHKIDLTNKSDFEDKIIDIIDNNKIKGWINTHYPMSKGWSKSPVSWEAMNLTLNNHLGSYIYISQLLCENSKHPLSIINLGSLYGSVSYDFDMYIGTNIDQPVSYPAIKSAIIQTTKMFAVKYAHMGHRLNCVSPGGVFNNHPKEFVKNYSKNTPLNRMANVDELFSAFDYFLSDKSSYTTGQNLIIDGGYSLK